MKNLKLFLLSFLLLSAMLYSCGGEGTDVVESGTYQGVIDEVEADKTEIYVKTADDKRLELYFTETTTLTKGGQEVPFETLKEGDKVEVQVEKVGQRLDPISVKVLE
jgi:2-keto-4-pentenoate hydratase/2-oxohepta-3-ene-1,7-dioic acid hydratase in catechol pathway